MRRRCCTALLHIVKAGARLAFSSPIAATGGAVMVEFGPPWIGSQFTSAHSERGYVGWVERSETHHSRHWKPVINGFRCALPILAALCALVN